jgi:hypothetical protein
LVLRFCQKKGIFNIEEFFMVTVTDTETATECIYGEDCPLHAENPPFNAKVLAAIEESKAIMRGDISAKWYKSLDEARKDLGV